MADSRKQFIETQIEGLRGMVHGDLYLQRYFDEWSENPVHSLFTFGNFLLVTHENDTLASHHHGFSQGVQAALLLREERNARIEKNSNNSIWALCTVLGGAGVSACIWTIARIESPFALVIACIVAGPCTLLHLVGAVMCVSHWLKPHMKESDVIPIEFDPDKRAKYLEEEEKLALQDFLKSYRDLGEDGSTTDV